MTSLKNQALEERKRSFIWPTVIVNLTTSEVVDKALSLVAQRVPDLIDEDVITIVTHREVAQGKQWIEGRLAPLVRMDRWREFVRLNYVPLEVLGGEQSLQIRVIFISNQLAEKEYAVQSWLPKIRKRIPGVEFQFSCIWVAAKAPKGELPDEVWPRFFVGEGGMGGRAPLHWRAQTIANVLIGMVQVDLRTIMESALGENKRPWVAIGASALVVQHRARERALQAEILKSMLRGSTLLYLDEEEEKVLKDEAERKVASILREARAILEQEVEQKDEEGNWQLSSDLKADKVVLKRVSLKPLSLVLAGQGASFGGGGDGGRVPWTWSDVALPLRISALTEDAFQALEVKLANEYARLKHRMERGLQRLLAKVTPVMVEELAFVIDRSQPGPLPPGFSLETPVGISAAVYLLEQILRKLTSTQFLTQSGQMIPSLQGNCWEAFAEHDVTNIRLIQRRLRRQQRTLMHPVVVALKAVILWPLWYLVVALAKPEWSAVQTTLASIGLCVGTIGAELCWRWYQLYRLAWQLQQEVVQEIARRVAGIWKGAWLDYLANLLAYWVPVRFALRQYAALLKSAQEQLVSEQPVQVQGEEGCVYWLNQTSPPLPELAQKALQLANAEVSRETEKRYGSVVEKVVGDSITQVKEGKLALQGPWLAQTVLQRLEEYAARWAQEVLEDPGTLVHVLPEQEKPLQKGQKWLWLWESARPLGLRQFTKDDLVLMIAHQEAVFIGPEGKASPFWREGWQIAFSHLPTEILCLRAQVVR